MLRGDLGKDIVSHANRSELLAQRLPVTFERDRLFHAARRHSSACRSG